MYKFKNYLLPILLGIITFSAINAQETTKTRIAFHNEIYTIDQKIDKSVEYFSQRYEGFRSAELFKIGEDKYMLEIEKLEDDEIKVFSEEITPTELEAIQKMVAKRVGDRNIGYKNDQSGRFLKVQSIAVQGGLVGLTASSLFSNNTDNFAWGAASPLLGLGGGLIGGILGTANRDVALAPSLGYASGANTGALHGFLIGSLFIDEFDDTGTSVFVGATLFSIGESILLQHIVRNKELSAQRASAIRLGNISGALTGLGMGLMLGGEEANRYALTGFTLAGSVGGMILYDKYFKEKNIAVGNMQAIRMMNPIFTIGTTIIISDLVDDFVSPAVSGAAAIASSVGGIFLGEALFGKGNVTYDESLWYGLGVYGGYLIGGGISILALENSNYDNFGATFAGITTFSMIGGLYLVHTVLANNQEENNRVGFFERNNLFIEANPSAIYVNKFIENPMFQQNALSIHWNF